MKPDNDHSIRLAPDFSYLGSYGKATFLADFRAGLTVAVFAVPQVMAYAMLAGLAPVYGLYTVIVASLIGATLRPTRPSTAIANRLNSNRARRTVEPNSVTAIRQRKAADFAFRIVLLHSRFELPQPELSCPPIFRKNRPETKPRNHRSLSSDMARCVCWASFQRNEMRPYAVATTSS